MEANLLPEGCNLPLGEAIRRERGSKKDLKILLIEVEVEVKKGG